MGGLIQPSPASAQNESNWRPIMMGVAAVVLVVGFIAFLLHTEPKGPTPPDPYATSLTLTDLKMSAAENFLRRSDLG